MPLRRRRESVITWLVLGPWAIVLAFPFYWMLWTALKTEQDLYNVTNVPYSFSQGSPTLDNVRFLFEETQYLRWLGNTALVGLVVVIITLAVGAIFFRVPLNPLTLNWPMFLAALVLGVICLTFMGVLLGAWTLTVRSEAWFVGDAVAAALYLFSGAIFPISILPVWLQPLGYAMPVTYWLELLRRAILGPGAAAFPTLAAFTDLQLFGILLGITIAFGLTTMLAYGYFDRLARERGLIDTYSNF